MINEVKRRRVTVPLGNTVDVLFRLLNGGLVIYVVDAWAIIFAVGFTL